MSPPWRPAEKGGSPELDGLGNLERRVMEAVWSLEGGATVRDVQALLESSLAYTTLMTTMDRLYKKGLLDRRRQGKAFVYQPLQSREEAHRGRALTLIQRLLQREPRPVLSCFVEAVSECDRELLGELERLVQSRRQGNKRR